jgi:hypothetical protein
MEEDIFRRIGIAVAKAVTRYGTDRGVTDVYIFEGNLIVESGVIFEEPLEIPMSEVLTALKNEDDS